MSKKLKVLNLVWEFPPWKVGGIATYLVGLSKSLTGKDVDCHVLCPGPEENDEPYEGVKVHRFKADYPNNDFISWVLQMNFHMKQKISEIWRKEGGFDIIHAHDWMSALPAIYAKETYEKPLVSTIHATEQGRWGKGQGVQVINELEHKLTYESWKITVLSDYMKWELKDLFHVPEEKIWVIPPGINPWEYHFDFDYWHIRNQFAAPYEKIVMFIGRMFPQKGCDILVGAAPQILEEFPNTKFVCVGKGFEKQRYIDLANWLGIGHKFYFTGFLDDYRARCLMQLANVLVVPSRQEPTGLVPLEGMAARTPVVASGVGGIRNNVIHDYNGFQALPESSDSISHGVKKILRNPGYGSRLVENGLKTLYEKFDWNKNTDIMVDCYKQTLREYQEADWGKNKSRVASLIQKQSSG